MAKSAKTGSNLSKGSGGAVSNGSGVSGAIPQHKRLAMGIKVDGETNPYGEDAPSTKPTIKGGW